MPRRDLLFCISNTRQASFVSTGCYHVSYTEQSPLRVPDEPRTREVTIKKCTCSYRKDVIHHKQLNTILRSHSPVPKGVSPTNIQSIKQTSCRIDYISSLIALAGSSHFDKYQCSQWWKSDFTSNCMKSLSFIDRFHSSNHFEILPRQSDTNNVLLCAKLQYE